MLKESGEAFFNMTFRYLINKVEEIYRTLLGQSTIVYSQDGEDIIFSFLFAKKSKGFYVDVGAHHPYRFSNTYLLYQRGWSGINIDATPGTMSLFNQARKRDINLEVAISQKTGSCYLYEFAEPALNFIKELNEQCNENDVCKKTKIQCITLKEVFLMHLKTKKIDLLLVDTEGYDLEVLKSNDWTMYRPATIMVEVGVETIDLVVNTKLHKFLISQNYQLAYKTYRNAIYLEK